MPVADKTLRVLRSCTTGRGRRILIYSYLLTSTFGMLMGIAIAIDDWSHGLTLIFAIASGMAVCIASMHNELVGDLHSTFRKRPRPAGTSMRQG